MIESITLRDFRGIEKGQLSGLRQINVLVGPNNSGKSALIEALYLACTVDREARMFVKYGAKQNQTNGDQSYLVRLAASDMTDHHPLLRIWQRHNYFPQPNRLGRWLELPQIIQVTTTDNTLPFTLFELSAGTSGEENTTALLALEPSGTEQLDGEKQEDPQSLFAQTLLRSEIEPFTQARLLFCWHPELTYYYKGSAAWLVRGVPAVARHTLFFDSTSVHGFIPLSFYQRMFNSIPGWGQRIGRHFAKIFNYDQPFVVQFLPTGTDRQEMQGWLAPEDRQALSIDAFGDGAKAAFKLLTYLTALAAKATPAEPGLFLWEEPESFQNPQTLARLLKEVIQIIQDKPIQLFIASHSLDLLANLTQLLRAEEISPDSTLAFHFDLADGHLQSAWFDKDNLIAWLETGFDPRLLDDVGSPYDFQLKERG